MNVIFTAIGGVDARDSETLPNRNRHLACSGASGPYYSVQLMAMVERWTQGPEAEMLDIWLRSLLGAFNFSPPRVSNPTAN